jgi:hypothetical protein
MLASAPTSHGAGTGNQTPVIRLEGASSVIELYPHEFGGAWRIRTPGTFLTYRLASGCFRPLSQRSNRCGGLTALRCRPGSSRGCVQLGRAISDTTSSFEEDKLVPATVLPRPMAHTCGVSKAWTSRPSYSTRSVRAKCCREW